MVASLVICAHKKSVSSHDSFWRYWAPINSVIWLVKSIPRCAWSPLCEKCPNAEFFLVRIFLYSVQIKEISDQKNSVFGHFSRSVHLVEMLKQFAVSLDIYQKTFKADLSFWSTLGMPSCAIPSPINYFFWLVRAWRGVILNIWTLFKGKNNILWIEYKEYKVKITMVQEQWLQPKMKFLLDYDMKIII